MIFDWTGNSWIIVVTGFLAAASCSLLGVFLVLRRMSLVADAISHAVLPGIVIAFLISNSRASLPVLIGAGSFGMLATFLIEWLHRTGKIQSDAAIGIVFTTLFALGVVIISAKAGMVDLDQDCVLYGEIAYTPWDDLIIGGASWGPRPLWILSIITLINIAFVVLFFKELKLSTFDPALATALGFSATLVHYLLMGLVSLTTVAAFDSVGAILVVAMFVVPAATSYLLTDRLGIMLGLSVIISALTALFGYQIASLLDASIAGSMTVATGLMFLLAFLFSPKHGLFFSWYHRFNLSLRIAVEDWAAQTFRFSESIDRAEFDRTASPISGSWWLPYYLRLKGISTLTEEGWELTDTGMRLATNVIRRHRSWEGYLHTEHDVPADHVHRSAHEVEHYLFDELPESEEVMKAGRKDPHGREIPE